MKKSFLSVLIFVLVILLPTSLFAEAGQRFKVDGYSLHINATKLSKKLIINGFIKGGDTCKNLKIYCYLINENNDTDRVIVVIKNYKHSKKFSLKKDLANNAGNRWTVSDVTIYK